MTPVNYPLGYRVASPHYVVYKRVTRSLMSIDERRRQKESLQIYKIY